MRKIVAAASLAAIAAAAPAAAHGAIPPQSQVRAHVAAAGVLPAAQNPKRLKPALRKGRASVAIRGYFED